MTTVERGAPDPYWPGQHAAGMFIIVEAVEQFAAGFASVRSLTPDQERVTHFGLAPAPVEEGAEPLECSSHMVATEKCDTPEEAAAQFANILRFPYPSLQERFDLYWRRMPELHKEADFAAGKTVYFASARYVVAVHKEEK